MQLGNRPLVLGVDVARDRIEYQLVAWGGAHARRPVAVGPLRVAQILPRASAPSVKPTR